MDVILYNDDQSRLELNLQKYFKPSHRICNNWLPVWLGWTVSPLPLLLHELLHTRSVMILVIQATVAVRRSHYTCPNIVPGRPHSWIIGWQGWESFNLVKMCDCKMCVCTGHGWPEGELKPCIIMYLGNIHNMSLVPVTFGNFFFQILQKWHFLG